MKIIDFEIKKISTVRFYLGNDDLKEWHGDDWDNVPYEHNARKVYEKYVTGTIDIILRDGDLIYEPCEGHLNSSYSKNDFVNRKVPCVIIVKHNGIDDNRIHTFEDLLGYEKIIKIYFGDNIVEVLNLAYKIDKGEGVE